MKLFHSQLSWKWEREEIGGEYTAVNNIDIFHNKVFFTVYETGRDDVSRIYL